MRKPNDALADKRPKDMPNDEALAALIDSDVDSWSLPPLQHQLKEGVDRKVRGCKEDHDYDITPWIVLWKENPDGTFRPRAHCLINWLDKHHAIAMANILAEPLGADRVTVALDSHISDQPTNPKTGKAWEPGDMQKACNDDGACDLGVITDCILAMEVTRDGQVNVLNRTYHVNHTTGDVHWQTLYSMNAKPDGQQMGGFVPDSLLASWREDYAETHAAALKLAAEMGLDSAEAEMHMAAASIKLAMAVVPDSAVMFIPETAEENEAFALAMETSLPDALIEMVPAMRKSRGIEQDRPVMAGVGYLNGKDPVAQQKFLDDMQAIMDDAVQTAAEK